MKALTKTLDFTGGFASLLCALHCLALPFILAFLPAWGLAFVGSHTFGMYMLAFTAIVGLAAIVQGMREHKSCIPMVKFGIGLILLVVGEVVLHNMVCEQPIKLGHRTVMAHVKGHPYHSFVSAFGGFMVMIAHILNRYMCKRNCKTCCEHE